MLQHLEGKDRADHDLARKLGPAAQPDAGLAEDLDEVVDEPDQAEAAMSEQVSTPDDVIGSW